MQSLGKALLFLLLAVTGPALAASPPEHRPELDRIGHIIVLFLENRSFDHLYGLFPGAEGIQDSGFASIQVSAEGLQFATLPAVINNLARLGGIDSRFAAGLPNGPFRADRYVSLEEHTSDPVHRFYQEQEQIDGGKMDRFVAVSDTGALPMGYFDGSTLPLFSLAREYTLADRFFHAAFGGALLNHFWLICACTPRYNDAPESLVAKVDADGRMIKDGVVTPDGYAVNTIDPVSEPHDPKITDDRQFLPLQRMPTIGRRLTDAGVSWAWYSGGFDGAVAGHPDPTFIYHHQPFAYFADYAAGTPGRAEHLKDERDMLRAIRDRTLPAVFELVLDKETVCKQFELPIDREGDFAAFSDRQTVVGARREDHDLSQLAGHRLRSHGGLGEQRVPFLVSTPLDPGWLAAHPRLRNYDIFDAALNAVVT